jgi:hypothetical protein
LKALNHPGCLLQAFIWLALGLIITNGVAQSSEEKIVIFSQ